MKSLLALCFVLFFVVPVYAIDKVIGGAIDAQPIIGLCGTFAMVQGTTLTPGGIALGGRGGLDINPRGEWAAGSDSDTAQTRVASRGATGAIPTFSLSNTLYSATTTNPVRNSNVVYDAGTGALVFYGTFSAATCTVLGTPCFGVRTIDPNTLVPLGGTVPLEDFNENSSAARWTKAGGLGYFVHRTSTGGAGLVFRKMNLASGTQLLAVKNTETLSMPFSMANDGTFTYIAQVTGNLMYQYRLDTFALQSSTVLASTSSGISAAYPNVALWTDISGNQALCEVALPSFNGCSSTYSFNAGTEGAGSLWIGYDQVNSRLYVIRSNTAGTVVGFIHRFSVKPLVKQASQALSYGLPHNIFTGNSVAYDVARQRITWLGSDTSADQSTINTISTCSNIIR